METIIELDHNNLPVRPITEASVPVIAGDGVGPDIWEATRPILEEAARTDGKKITFIPVIAGEAAFKQTDSYLPDATLDTLKKYRVSLKGPLGTPIGGGIRSLNVAIRHALDLYACVRPIKWLPGVPSPVKHPEKVDMVIFRENTEDVYAGLEWPAGSQQADDLISFVNDRLQAKVRPGSAVGLKPMSAFGSQRLVRMAVKWALREKRPNLTLVHKGNIMKFTEGGFRTWGYEICASEFAGLTATENDSPEIKSGRLIIKDRIADNMFMQSLLRPEEYSILAMPNLNGDYLSDCLAGQIGGLGMAPGANIGDGLAVFEATHGTAPKYAGLDMVNPSSLILSGAMLLEFIGWPAASEKIKSALAKTFDEGLFTYDLARQAEGGKKLACSEFGRAVLERL
ncbi:MAG: NADP-dependent isocitrate dehydrogenase [Deltaproteobacteria bacterium]|jgi:isocitrate dehydrogenase|nr:NADP-dependent isocitrate dehydrogenase [Deltaproteobacteria bacterium]